MKKSQFSLMEKAVLSRAPNPNTTLPRLIAHLTGADVAEVQKRFAFEREFFKAQAELPGAEVEQAPALLF